MNKFGIQIERTNKIQSPLEKFSTPFKGVQHDSS